MQQPLEMSAQGPRHNTSPVFATLTLHLVMFEGLKMNIHAAFASGALERLAGRILRLMSTYSVCGPLRITNWTKWNVCVLEMGALYFSVYLTCLRVWRWICMCAYFFTSSPMHMIVGMSFAWSAERGWCFETWLGENYTDRLNVLFDVHNFGWWIWITSDCEICTIPAVNLKLLCIDGEIFGHVNSITGPYSYKMWF